MSTDSALPPFACTISPSFADVLSQLGCSLAISTYQAGKVIFLSPGNGQMELLPRQFDKPMGMAYDGKRLAVATRSDVHVLANASNLAPVYPPRPQYYDGMFIPRAAYWVGELDLHDLAWQGETLWAVNTRFSCIGTVDTNFNYNVRWRPSFISELAAEDRAHLNGLAMGPNGPEFVSALGSANTKEGWRQNIPGGGILMHIPSGQIVMRNLGMPHSPRIYPEGLFMLISAEGQLVKADPNTGKYEVVAQLPGFARGIDRIGNIAFIGISRLRSTHRFAGLPIASWKPFCGVVAVDLTSGQVIGTFEFMNSCEEIYDVLVLPKLRRPNILRMDDPFIRDSLDLPGAFFWSTPQPGQPPAPFHPLQTPPSTRDTSA